MTGSATVSEAQARADTLRWLERAVIGLNLCPFAKAVHVRGSRSTMRSTCKREAGGLIDALLFEARALAALRHAASATRRF